MLRSSKLYMRKFHTTSKLLLRKVGPKTSSNVENREILENSLELSSNYQSPCLDYLGIENDENLITVIPQKHRLQHSEVSKNKEKFYRASFGIVRFDADNKPKYHGQHENKISFTFPHNSSEDVKVSNISEVSSCENQILQNLFFKDSQVESSSHASSKSKSNERSLSEKNDVCKNYIEEFYFGTSDADNLAQNNAQSVSEELNYLEKDYFETVTHPADKSLGVNSEYVISKEKEDSMFCNKNQIENVSYLEKDYIKTLTSSENLEIEEHSTDYYKLEKNDSILDNGQQSDELNFLDKTYFGALSSSENHNMKEKLQHNAIYDNKIDSALHLNKEDVFSKNNNLTPTFDELNLPDKSHYKNYASSNYQNSLNYDDLLETSSPLQKDNNIINKDACIKSSERSQNLEPDYMDTNRSIHELTQKQNYEANLKKKNSDTTQKNNIMSYESTEPLVKKSNMPKEMNNENDRSFSVENNLKFSKTVSEVSDQNNEMSTAHDFVQKLREKEKIPSQIISISKGKSITQEKFDSKGFRILKNQVPNLSYFTHDEILNILKESVVYSDDDLLILNKPYSLVIHESKTTKEPCLSSFLDDLAKEMNKQSTNPKLFTVHRLDKETTGCLMLARNETMAMKLKALLAQRKIVKKYWIITAGVPNPPEGIIDIPISEGSIKDRKRMVLHPKLPSDIPYRNHSKSGKPAVTTYKVISESGSAALVEVFPKTGVKHQIRVHFGFGLGCPVLGDHKYSHLDKLTPQKLPADMLQNLYVRQSKVRHIPMHIHAKSIGIPQYFDNRDLFVNIPIPDHFKINLKRLKFRKKDMIH